MVGYEYTVGIYLFAIITAFYAKVYPLKDQNSYNLGFRLMLRMEE